jgi:hypothetical protein
MKIHVENLDTSYEKRLELSWSLTWFSICKLMAKSERSMGY